MSEYNGDAISDIEWNYAEYEEYEDRFCGECRKRIEETCILTGNEVYEQEEGCCEYERKGEE